MEIFSDARIALDQPGIPQGLRVHVDQGAVTLTGSVSWPLERTAAEDIVRGINGVRDVVNNIVVAPVASEADFEPPVESGQ
jgi:hypothetical protein